MRTPIIAGNWKMNTTLATAAELTAAMRDELAKLVSGGRQEIVLCPPFISLARVAELVKGSGIQTGAQNMYFEAKGAFTGEIAPNMLSGLVQYVILGHSERRQYFGETDEGVNKKIKAALANNLKPIVCIGENLQQNEAGQTNTFVGNQVRAALAGLSADQVRGLVLAYEPIWAIGTGKAATGAGANAVIAMAVRGPVADLYGEAVAQAVRVQYGGSVTAKNIDEFIVQPDIDGALVGGASLKPEEFIPICQAGLKKA
ncbi:MAG: triose-phosphate isomerase [Anaerolineae bacterium]